MRVRTALLAALLVAAPGLVPAVGADPDPGCAAPGHDGGSWPSLNHDLRNTRNQPDEDVIGPEDVADLSPEWTFDAAAADPDGDGEPLGPDAGSFQSTPVVADGCLYVASSTGWIFALNADTGGLVWSTHVPTAIGDDGGQENAESLLGLAVANGRVYAHYFPRFRDFWAVALDRRTGSVAEEDGGWFTKLDTAEGMEPGDGQVLHASPVVNGDVLFTPVSRGVGDESAPPLFFLDAADGSVLETTIAVPEEERAQGYAGAGAWSTAAVDTAEDVLYVGTADAEGFRREHRYNNAILKIDLDRTSESFGEVLDAYKGSPEQYVEMPLNAAQRNPACQAAPALVTLASSSATCLQLDLDFGASPNLFRDDGGRLLVGAFQKSGVYHAAFTDTMTASWRRILSSPSAAGNAGSATFDGDQIIGSANPSTLFSLELQDGLPRWLSSTGGDVVRYQPVTSANGVAYTMSVAGVLTAHDTATGAPLTTRSIAGDVGEDRCLNLGGGVSIARNTVYAQCDSDTDGTGHVVGYRVQEMGGGY